MPYTLKERESIQKAYESLLVDIRPNVNDPQKLKVVEDAYQFCLEKYDGKYLASGKAYLFHLIELARIAVLEVGLGYMSVVAAFLHGITYKEQVPMDYLEERYGKRIATVLKGFDKISALPTCFNDTFWIFCIHQAFVTYIIGAGFYLLGKGDVVSLVLMAGSVIVSTILSILSAQAVRRCFPKAYRLLSGGR